jgi:putative salt-induced outer membrane protein
MKEKRAGRNRRTILSACFLALVPLLAICGEEKPAKGPWRLRSEISYAKTSGNTDTESFAGKLDSAREGRVHKLFLKGQYVYGRNSGREDANKLALDGRWEAALNERFSGIVSAGYGRDKFSGYRFRVFIGPGLGYYLVKRERQSLQLSLALNYYHDRFSVGERQEQRSLTGKTLAKFEWRPRDNFKFSENLGFFHAFNEAGRYFVESETAAEVRINRIFSFGVSFKYNFQNRPPAPEIQKIDTTFLTALIIDLK